MIDRSDALRKGDILTKSLSSCVVLSDTIRVSSFSSVLSSIIIIFMHCKLFPVADCPDINVRTNGPPM